jgi:HK97 family phage portal protein
MLNNLFEQRAISFQTIWGSGGDIELQTNSGTYVTQDNVWRLAAITGAVNLIASSISTLPMEAWVRRDGQKLLMRPKPDWVNRPDISFVDRTPFISQIITSLMFDGNAFIRIFRDEDGLPINLMVMNPTEIEVTRNAQGRVVYKWNKDGSTFGSDDMLHIVESLIQPGQVRGVSRISVLKENLGLGMALESYAQRFFGQGATGNFAITVPGALTPEQAKQMADSVDGRHGGWRKSSKTIVMHSGAEIEDIGIDPERSQAIEARRMFVEDVARIYNIPTHKLQLPGTNTYSSIEQTQIEFVTDTLRPYTALIENALSTLLQVYPNGQGAFLEFNMAALLRGDINSRAQAASVAIQGGWLTINDVRQGEGLSKIDGGDVLRVPLANVPIDAADLTATDKKVAMAQKLVQVGYEPADVLAQLGLPAIKHTGIPSVQLQGVAQIDPADPQAVYETDN